MFKYSASFLLAVMMLMLAAAAAAGEEDYIGEISLFAGNYEPRDYAFCDGRLLPIAEYTALYSILGTTYGGDGRSNFALPNLEKAEKGLGGARYIIRMNGLYPSRN
jgi:microcystin-dependent protein